MQRNIVTIANEPLPTIARKLASLAAVSVISGCLLAVTGCSGAGEASSTDPASESTEVGTTSSPLIFAFGCLGTQVALQAWNNQYVVAEGGGGGVVNANRTARGAWETFTVRENFDAQSSVSFQANNGNWVVAEGGGGGVVNANRTAIGAWEKFIPEATTDAFGILDKWAFKAANGQYVVAEGGGGGVVNANRTAIGPWEKFTVVCL